MLATHRLAGMGLLRDRMLLFLVMCLGASLCITGSPLAQPLPAQLDPVTRLSSHTGLPLQFIANQGQADSGVAFEARGASGTLMFSRQRISLALPMSEGDFPPKGTAVSGTSPSVLSIELLGADSTTEIVGTGLLPGVVNYVIGNDPSRWYLGIETHAGILYRSLYPGVDLAYYGSEGLLKGTYTVAPGADPAQIRWRYDGAANVNLNEAMGALQIAVATGTGAPEAVVTEYAPIAWQDIGSSRVNVPVRYQIEHGETISFVVGAYDQRYPLVIDPILEYSSYLGGNTGDTGYDIALDGDGNIYIAGGTTSANFPGASGSPGGWQMSWDVVVIKFSADGSTLLYTTIFGGGGQDDARGIAVDSAGSAHIVGWTGSPDLPVVNAIQPSYGGDDYDMFVAKLSPDGQHIVYSTFLGGNKYDLGNGIALDNQGNAYAIGTTSSWGLLIQAAFQPYPVGCQDVYLVKLTPVGAMAYGTYLGGPNCESGAAVAVDDLGNAYLVGTAAPQYPLMNPAQNCSPFSYDAFVTKLTPDGQALVYSTCLGGSGSEEGLGLALDSSHRAYVVGLTSSSDFPTVQAVQSTSHGSLDAFIARLSADGQAVEYSTYLGGIEQDRAHGVTVTGGGSAVLTGQTMSVDFPLADPLQNAHAGSDWDVFVTKLTADGTALEFSTYLGGAGPDVGLGIASDSAGSIYVTGLTDSYNFPVLDPFQSSNRGYSDIFLTVLGDGNHPPTVSAGGPYTVDEGSSIVLVADGSDPEIGALTYTWDLDLDGVFESPGQSVTFSAVSLDGPDVRTVAVQVTDLGGLIATAQAQVVIPNVEPSASFVATPAAVPEGQSATLIFSDSLDPGLADTAAGYQYSYDCSGDGVLEVDDTTASSVACPYLDDGVYAAAGRIKDKDGGFTDYTASVVVSNVTPSVGPIAVQVFWIRTLPFGTGATAPHRLAR